jgi:hypothetical protein
MTGLENRKKGKFFLEFSAILEVAERQEVHTPFLFFHQGLGVFFFFFLYCLFGFLVALGFKLRVSLLGKCCY